MTRFVCFPQIVRPHRSLFNILTVMLVTSILCSFLLYVKKDFVQSRPIRSLEKKNPAFSLKDMQFNLLGIESIEVYGNRHMAETLNCSEDLSNAFRLQQDHPCVIDIIRRQYLKFPEQPETSLKLDYPEEKDPSEGQSKYILSYLKNKTKGFFIECGAADGEFLSNTLYMERYLGWGGILIEADRKFYDTLLTRKRRAFTLHVCLSLEPYPTTVYFREDNVAGKIEEGVKPSNLLNSKNGNLVSLQCFPLYSILLAVGKTKVDYFSVDVEGSETKILKTIPWHKVDIKTLTVEVTSRNMSVVDALTEYMEKQQYRKVALMDGNSYFDLVFVKKKL